MICPIEIASEVSAWQAAVVGEHGRHAFSHAGRDAADDEGTGSDFAGGGEEDHVVPGGGGQIKSPLLCLESSSKLPVLAEGFGGHMATGTNRCYRPRNLPAVRVLSAIAVSNNDRADAFIPLRARPLSAALHMPTTFSPTGRGDG
jgi:hypothetical protein